MKRILLFLALLTILISGIASKPFAYGISLSDKIEKLQKKGYTLTRKDDTTFIVETPNEKKSQIDNLVDNLYIGSYNDSDLTLIAAEFKKGTKYESVLAIMERDYGKPLNDTELNELMDKYGEDLSDEEAIKMLFSGQLAKYIATITIAETAAELSMDDDVSRFTIWQKKDMGIFVVESTDKEVSSFVLNTDNLFELVKSEALKMADE